MRTRILGFSLIELMVVIAIVAILASIAYPAYRTYIIKTRVAQNVVAAQTLADKIIKQADRNGAVIAPVTIDGISLNGNSLYVHPPSVYVYYQRYNDTSFIICTHATGLEGIPSYVAPNASGFSVGQYGRVCVKVIQYEGLYYKFCGQNVRNHVFEIPMAYLPAGCKCGVLDTVWNPITDSCV